MRRLLLLASLLLATACAPVVVTVPVASGGEVLPAEAQRVIDRATATAAVAATQAAQATALRVQTLEALDLESVQLTRAAAQTQDVISRTAVAATAAAQATVDAAATQETGRARAQATAAAWEATQSMAGALATQVIRREEQRTQLQTGSAVLSMLLKGLALVAGLFALYFVVAWVGGVVDADVTRRKNAAAYRETPIGAVLLMADPGGGYNYRLIEPPSAAPEVIEAPPARQPEPSDRIAYTVQGRAAAPIVADWRAEGDDALREEIADLLREAIKVDGNDATRIPRYSRLATWSTNPEGWKRLTDVLMAAGHVTKVAGKNGGTFVTRGRTLYQLLTGLLDRTASLAPVDVVSAER